MRTRRDLHDHDVLAHQLGATVVRDRAAPGLCKHGARVEWRELVRDQRFAVRWRAELPPPGVPRFRIYPEGFTSFISKAFGGQDVEIGVAALDLMFMVKARDPAAVRQLWTPRLCAQLVALGELATIRGDGPAVVLEQRFHVGQEIEVVPGIELLFDLAAVVIGATGAIPRAP